MSTLATLTVNLVANAGKFRGELDDAAKRSQKFSKTVTKSLQTVGKVALGIAGAGIAALGAGLAILGPKAIDAASDFEESMAKVEVVFGDASTSVINFSKTAATSMGISQREALATAGTFGNLFTTMGIGEQAAADMSIDLVSLAADLASFNNISPTEALDKLRAGLVGEAEPLRTLGIQLSAVAVETKAVEMGLADAGGELSEAAKLQARYALILEQSGNAAGDFARTSDGLANTQRILKAVWQDTLQEIGRVALPVLLAVLERFKPILFDQILPALETVLGALGLFVDQITSGTDPLTAFKILLLQLVPREVYDTILQVVEGVQTFIETVGPVVEQVGAWLAENVKLQDVLLALGIAIATVVIPAIGALLSGPLAVVIAVFAGVVAAVVLLRAAWENNFLGIRDKTEEVIAFIRTFWAENGEQIIADVLAFWENVKAGFSAALTFINTLVTTVLTQIRAWWDEHGQSVMTIAQSVWDFITTIVESNVNRIIAAVQWFVSMVEQFIETHGDTIMTNVQIVWDTIQQIIEVIGQNISDYVDAFAAALSGDWETFGQLLRDIWDRNWEMMVTALKNFGEIIGNSVQSIIDAVVEFFQETDWGAVGKSIIDGIANGISNGAGAIADAARSAAQAAYDAAKGFLGFNSPAKLFIPMGRSIPQALGVGIEDDLDVIERAAQEMGRAAMSASGGMVDNRRQTNIYVSPHYNRGDEPTLTEELRLLAMGQGVI